MKEINEMKRFAKRLGFKYEILRNGHIRFSGYNYVRVASGSPSDYRTLDKVKKDLQAIVDKRPNKFCHKVQT